MGIYLNPGNDGFLQAIRSKIYVDKTGLIGCTNECLCTEQKYFCVSRPRRFGKSMALGMLAAYYGCGYDSRELFRGLKIESNPSFEEHLNQYDVIYLDMTRFLRYAEGKSVSKFLEKAVLEELREAYGDLFPKNEKFLSIALEKIYAKTKRKFVFLVDEWDCIMRERQKSKTSQEDYLDFLRDLLKGRFYVALAYMTGILPVKKYGVHSSLNMFTEYSMIDQSVLEEYTGFTEDEVKGLCERFDMDFEEISSWYDGYQLTKFQHIYNPKSVVEAMCRHRCQNYWTLTETYQALKVHIDRDLDGLRTAITGMLGGGCVKVNTLTFQNDMQTFHTKDDVLTLLIHLGYLAYDSEREDVFIPNNEILIEFKNAISDGGWEKELMVLDASEQLLQDTLNCQEEVVANALDNAHTMVSSSLTYNREDSLAAAILLAYYSARKEYRITRELPAGYGFADIVFYPLASCDKPAMIVELKYNQSAETAIRQMKNRKYLEGLKGHKGEVLLVGINYDRKTNQHTCKIEKVKV